MRTNWGAVVVDLAIIGIAAYSHIWMILWLLLFTGGYSHSK